MVGTDNQTGRPQIEDGGAGEQNEGIADKYSLWKGKHGAHYKRFTVLP